MFKQADKIKGTRTERIAVTACAKHALTVTLALRTVKMPGWVP